MVRRWWPVLFLILVPLLPLWRAIAFKEAIGPFDQIHQMAPWNGPHPTQPWDVLQADGVLQFYTWRDLVFDSWGKGLMPFWNPYALAGTPLLGNSQSAGFYPPHILMGLLHVPTGLAMVLLAWAHLAWAALGTYVLIRRFGGSRVGACLGGTTFALSPFMIGWTALPSVITTVSWIPWLLAAVAALFFNVPIRRTALDTLERFSLAAAAFEKDAPDDGHEQEPSLDAASSPRERAQKTATQAIVYSRSFAGTWAGLATSFGMLILSGHLQFVAYGTMGALLLAIVLSLTSPNPLKDWDITSTRMHVRSNAAAGPPTPLGAGMRLLINPVAQAWVFLLLALGIGGAIAAPQLLPVLSYSQFSHRRGAPTSVGYAAYVSNAIRPFELASVPFATVLGNPTEPAEASQAGAPTLSTYWPPLVKQGGNFAESAICLGPLVLGLLFLAPWRRQKSILAPIAVVGLFSLLLALGTALNMLLYYGVPGWSASGSPGRAISLFVLAAAVLAGLSIDKLSPLPDKGFRRLVPILLPAFLAVLFVGICTLMMDRPMPGIDQGVIFNMSGAAFTNATPFLLIAVVVAAAAIASAYHLDKPRNRALVLAAPIALFLLDGGLGLVRTGDPGFLKSPPLKPADANARVAVINDPWSLLVAAPAVAPPNTLDAARIHELSGYDSLLHRESVALLKDIDGKDAAAEANGNIMYVKPTADPAKLAAAGVTEVWTRKELPAFGTPYAIENGVFRYTLPGPGRASTPQGPAQILDETLSQLRLRATGPGPLVLRDRNMPGWSATVDGHETPIQGTTWREVALSPGDHTVQFDYVPPGLSAGKWLGAGGMLTILAVFFYSRKRTSIGNEHFTPGLDPK